ncbi:hypothetical protein ACV8SG_26440, partial [Citrobacter freundii]
SIIRPGSLFCITTSLIVKITSANHPVIHTPPAATSWASCLFAVDDERLPKVFIYVNTQGIYF